MSQQTTTETTTQNDTENLAKGQRFFKCWYNDQCFGRYSGIKPKQAASKAFTALIRNNGGNNDCVNKAFKFEMVECTRNSKRKHTFYEGTRFKLDKPLAIKFKGSTGEKTITYNFTNKVKKFKDVKK